MAPSKRRKTSAESQPTSGNASSGVRTRRSTSARGDLPDDPDADLDAEPEVLMCPITRAVFRDPVMVVDSGHTYERSAILSHFDRNGAKDPLTRRALSSTKVMTNWAMRNVVQDWLDKHPGVTPDGWDSRELLEPSKDDGTRSFDDEGDVGVLRTWRAMCPELQEWWPEAARPEHWEGVTLENGRVVQLKLEEFGLTGAVPAEIGRLSALRELDLDGNELTSLPAEIGQLTSLEKLYLVDNQLTSLPAEIGQLTSLTELYLEGNQLTSLPANIGQLASLEMLDIRKNQLTSVLAEIGQLTSLERLHLDGNRLTSVPANIGQLTLLKELYLFNNQLTSLPAEIGQLTALEELRLGGNLLMSVPVEIGQLTSLETLFLYNNKLTSVPAEIGQLTSLRELDLSGNRLTSVPANIGQLTALKQLNLSFNKLTRLPAAIRELIAAGCHVVLDDGVRVDE
jgi:leucine-rich repeat protein SHOC2